MKQTFGESLKRKLHQYLTEERGINEEVTKATQYILSNLKNWLSQGRRVQRDDGVVFTTTTRNENILGIKLGLKITLFEMDNHQYMEFEPQCFYNRMQNLIQLEFASVDGEWQMNDLYDVLQHELHHLCQAKHNPNDGIDKLGLYDTAIRMIHSNNPFAEDIGRVIYLSYEDEQQAFANGLYAQLRNNPNKSWQEVYEQSTIKGFINYLKEIPIQWKNYVFYIQMTCMACGLNLDYDKLIDMCQRSYEKLLRKAGKVISLVNDEREREMN